MLDLQRRLQARFDELRDTRHGPVFFVEHGLLERDIDEIIRLLREFLATQSLEEPCWDRHPLPLIVVATEVGYQYRGTGTDFWPIVEDQLGVGFSAASRQRVRDLFAAATQRHRGAIPPDSPWSSAFRLIAWPITHAMIPFEFHRPLAVALANLNASVGSVDDDELHIAVRRAAGHISARFDSWLSDPRLVVAVVRNILGEATTDITAEVLERVRRDLARDDVTRAALALARRAQGRAPTTRSKRSRAPEALPPRRGRLQLRRRGDQLALEAVFPRLDVAVLDPLRRALRRRRYSPRLWGVSAPVPGEQLICGVPFLLKLSSAVVSDADLLPGLADLEIEEGHRTWLSTLHLEFTPPVLFACSADGVLARAIRGSSISGTRRYWMVVPHDTTVEMGSLPRIGDVGPYTCIAVDPSIPADVEILQRLGYRVRFGLAVGFAGPPSLERDAAVPTYLAGDQRLVSPRRPHPSGTVVGLHDSSKEIPLADNMLVKVAVQEGEHVLTIRSPEESQDYQFRGATKAPAAAPACRIELVGPEITVQALLAGTMSLRVDGVAPLQGTELTVELEAAGRRIGVSMSLDPLPVTIPGESTLWNTILDDTSRRLLLQDTSPLLSARVGVLAASSWPLEQRVTAYWWEASGASVSLRSELGVHEFGGVSAGRPLETPTPNVVPDDTEAVLLAPLSLDLSTLGPSAAFSTCCVAPARLRLDPPGVRKPRLRRRRRGQRKSTGLEDLVEAYLRWALAQSTSLVAEMRRRQVVAQLDLWISEVCCGEEWAMREAELQATTSEPWKQLLEICERTGLGSDPYVALPLGDEAVLAGLAVDEIRRSIPDLWTRVGAPAGLEEDDPEALDLAFERAYTQLARSYRRRGREDLAARANESDPGTDAESWGEALGLIHTRAELHGLAELLMPSSLAAQLLSLDYTMMSQGDLLEELVSWSRRAQRALASGAPDVSAFRTALELWLAPETVVNRDWQGALDVLLADRCLARAVRYMCLRGRDLGGRGSE